MPAKLESLGPRSADGPLRTAVAKAIILPLWGPRGIDQLESFGFWRRKFCIKNAEILSVGKIAEFAKFAGGKRRKSPDRFSLIRATASYGWSSSFDLLAVGRGRVPLNIKSTVGRTNESRFATSRGWDLRERVRCPTIFSKSLIRHLMTGGWLVANRWSFEMLESLFALADYILLLVTLTPPRCHKV